jgi:hypothetical protein
MPESKLHVRLDGEKRTNVKFRRKDVERVSVERHQGWHRDSYGDTLNKEDCLPKDPIPTKKSFSIAL